MLGCVRFNDADDLENVLCWMDENTDGKPYGVDIVMPAKIPTEGTAVDINKLVPQSTAISSTRRSPTSVCRRCPMTRPAPRACWAGCTRSPAVHVEVALKHPIKLIANALGSPPKDVIDQVHEAGVPVAALAGSPKHALRHAENGVDIVVAQGHEAGGHTGEIGSMVLWPEIVDAARRQDRGACRGRYRHRPPGRRRAGARRPGSVDGLGVPDVGRIRPRGAAGLGPRR